MSDSISLFRRLLATVLVVALSLVWFDQLWLFGLTVALGLLSIWFSRLRSIIWLATTLIVVGLIGFFIWRPGGASYYTNTGLSMILTFSLIGALLELVMARPSSNEK